MNISDTERIETVLNKMGLKKTENEEDADLLGIVACSVRQRAIDRVYGKIKKWNQAKSSRNIITFVSGCILEEDEKKFLKLFDFLFRMNELPDLPNIIKQYGVVNPTVEYFQNLDNNISDTDFWKINPNYNSDFQAFVPIQNGCDKFCSYCAVPYTRGREVSRPSIEILEEINNLIQNNYKSITLLGQNVNSYGLDKKQNEISFAELLEKIGNMIEESKKEVLIYFTSPHPSDMNIEVFKTMAKFKCLAKWIHLPLQAGDNTILKKMNRSYSIEDFTQIVNSIKKIIPETVIFTDIIVGFPGETEKQFEKSREALINFKFNMAYIAIYSPRPGALSSKMNDDIPQHEKKRRLHILTEELKKCASEQNKKMKNKIYRILVEGQHSRKKNYLVGRTEGLIPVQFQSENKKLIGQFINIKITGSTPLSVEGIIAE